MELISDEIKRRKITITFTEDELGELVAAMGSSSHSERSESAKFNEIPCTEDVNVSHQLFLDLRAILKKGSI